MDNVCLLQAVEILKTAREILMRVRFFPYSKRWFTRLYQEHDDNLKNHLCQHVFLSQLLRCFREMKKEKNCFPAEFVFMGRDLVRYYFKTDLYLMSLNV